MVLEATLVCLDNSEFMRNGDYTPSRLEAQNDAVGLICGAKTQSNPENTVGVMTAASKRPEVLVTLTTDIGKILSAVHGVQVSGGMHFSDSLQIAYLALKHRQNKNQRQRVIAFVGSPIEEDENELVKLAKKLKKNNVAVDIINFGEEAENTAKLEAFIAAINNSDNSHLVTIPPGPHILSDILISSPILNEEGGEGPIVSGGGGFEFGVDPNIDPELALALRISMEEERQRQERLAAEQKKPEGESSAAAAPSSTSSSAASASDVSMQDSSKVESSFSVPYDDDEAALLEQAIQMSMASNLEGMEGIEELSEEEQLQRALEMSSGMHVDESALGEMMQNPEFLSNILGSLPGVDPNDPRIKSALEEFSQESEEKKDKKKEKKDKEDQEKGQ